MTNLTTGESRVFRTEDFEGEPPADQIRVMDCMDCHNRPAHTFPTANNSVEQAMLLGKVSTKLPNIKRVAVQAMTEQDIATIADAPLANELTGTIAAVQQIYDATIFPERKADWRVYPDNIGHTDWPGCFRCHDDKHQTSQGLKVRSSDCNSCHTILAQGTGEQLASLSAQGLDFAHPDGDLDEELTCTDCHNGGIQK